jgi:hypothetical protein
MLAQVGAVSDALSARHSCNEVSTAVSGGVTASVAIGAIAADVATTMAVMGRSIGVVASTYGYDVRQPEEEFFALGVLSLASALS